MTSTSHRFSVGADGHVEGDDGRNGGLAGAVHYAARMAAQLDSTLGLGELHGLHVTGETRIDAAIGWGFGGECLLRADVAPGTRSPLTMPGAPVPTGVTPGHLSEAIWHRAREGAISAGMVDDAVRAVHTACEATWTMLLDGDLTPLRQFGSLDPRVVQVTASRCHGVVRGLGVRDVDALTLVYGAGALVLFPVGTQTVVVHSEHIDADALRCLHEAARDAALDPASVLGAPPLPEPDRVEVHEVEDDALDEFDLPTYDFVPAGARFAGQLQQRAPRARRWGRL